MKRLDLYFRARAAINEKLLVAIMAILSFFCLGLFGKSLYAAVQLAKSTMYITVPVILMCSTWEYCSHLDDIFYKKTKTYVGYVDMVKKRRQVSYDGVNADFYEKMIFVPFRRLEVRLNCSLHDKGADTKWFKCYYKKIWEKFRIGQKVEVTYLGNSEIIVDVMAIEDSENKKCNSHKRNQRPESKSEWRSRLIKV